MKSFMPIPVLAISILTGCGEINSSAGSHISQLDQSANSDARIVYAVQAGLSETTMERKIAAASYSFLNTPYLANPLGEGDQNGPLYRADGFDCTTFIETTMAVALSQDLQDFKSNINQIRYKDAEVSLTTRNHFPDADWLKNNSSSGILTDVTSTVARNSNLKVFSSTAVIDRKSWFQAVWKLETNFAVEQATVPYLDIKDFFLPGELEAVLNAYKDLEKRKIAEIKAAGSQLDASLAIRDEWRKELSAINLEGVVRQDVLDKIPSGAIMNLVTPNWILKNSDGSTMTGMNIGHQTLVIRNSEGRLVVREASKTWQKVQDVPLAQYLLMKLTSSTQKGVNFYRINDRRS